MSSPTLSLSVLVLACAAFPAQLFRVGLAMTAGGGPAGGRLRAVLRALWLPGAFLLVAALVWYVAPDSGVVTPPPAWWWYGVSVAIGLAAPAWEVAAGAAVVLARGRRVGRAALHERWGGAGTAAVATAVAVAVAEEVIFRGVGLYLLVHALGSPLVLAVALTAVVYGLNHLYFGWSTVLQKTVTGVVFGLLCAAAGYSLLVPLLAHVAQNLVVLVGIPAQSGTAQSGTAQSGAAQSGTAQSGAAHER